MKKRNIVVEFSTDTSSTYYYNNLGDSVSFDSYEENISIPAGYSKTIRPTNLDLVFSELKRLIHENNLNEFNKVASGPCLYEHKRTWSEGRNYYPDGDYWTGGGKYETWTYRPRLEALFLEKPNEFKELLTLLIEKNDQKYFKIFGDCLGSCFLKQKSFYTWDSAKDGELILKKIISLKDHLETVDTNTEKYKKITQLINDLEEKINSFQDIAEDNIQQKQIRCLLFRYELFTMAHREDKYLKQDKPYLRLIANICSVLFTAGIANLINYMFTGKFTFFAQKPLEAGVKELKQNIIPKI